MKASTMKSRILAAALLVGCSALTSAAALEITATSREVNSVDPNISVNAQNAALVAAITKVNKDLLAVMTCNKKSMFYKPADSIADADGCVGATMTTTTTTHTVDLPNINFDSYPDHSRTKKGYTGKSNRVIDLSDIASKGATSISVTATRSGFAGNCQKGPVTMNIANVNASYGTTEFKCHYDNSPNRTSYFRWSYNGGTKQLSLQAAMGQTHLMTDAKLLNIKATYQVTKTVLKVGSGQ